MLGALNGPWLLATALLLLAAAVWRGPRPERRTLWLVATLVLLGAAARLAFGVWGPMHVNGQGPLWISGALDPAALQSYGPGYFELFGWLRYLPVMPDRAIFAANALLSALSPALLYAAARLVGVERGGALAAAVVLAIDAVTIRTAASELYVWPLIALVLAVQAALGVFVHATLRDDRLSAALALAAASLLSAAAARIQPVGYLLLATSPLLILCAARPERWEVRLTLAAWAAAAIAATVLLISGSTVVHALNASPVSAHDAFASLRAQPAVLLVLLLAAVWLARRWARPPWLPLFGVASLLLVPVIATTFQRHPFQAMVYVRLCWPGLLLGAAALLPRRMQGVGWALVSAVIVAAAAQIPALPYLGARTTEQLEYGFLQEVLPRMPPTCTLASVSRAGKRVWAIPSYLAPSGRFQEIEGGTALRDVVEGAECVVYVRSSLCSSAEGRALCESTEREVPLEYVASQMVPAAPSDVGLPYDRPAVEVKVFRAAGHGGAEQNAPVSVGEGAAITPQFAQDLYNRIAPLREPDGCQLVRFDTGRVRITLGLHAPSGAEHLFEIAHAPSGGESGRRAGQWALAVPPELERECGATLAAIERVLVGTGVPARPIEARVAPTIYTLLQASFVLLVLGTLHLLYRQARVHRPSPYAVLALVLVWGAALALRLTISPRTFLHEYYHVAETVSAYLTGEIGPAYGKTGPALIRLAGALLGQPQNVQVIFITNAVLASLAVPAVALLDLALMRSWPRALCAAVLLCVLPHHLRFSAAEDLFVLAVTFGMWALALFALFLRTRRLGDALMAALALSLAMQSRPEMLFFPAVLVAMVLLVEPRSWRVLIDWHTLLALSVLGALLVPRLVELQQALHQGSPAAALPDPLRYVQSLVLLHAQVTPPAYWVLLAVGLAWGAVRKPGLDAWVLLVFFGYTLFSFSIFDNPPYHLRSQLLPTSFTVLGAAGAASAWMEWWGPRRRAAVGIGAGALTAVALAMVVQSQPFVTELRDQQLEWAFLDRVVPLLPGQATLLSAVEIGGNNLDAFPEFLLQRDHKTYQLIDVRRAAAGGVAWPPASDDLLYYQGMFCYFAFGDDASPDPMTAPCRAVHERYVVEPLFVEDLHTQGYSWLRYAHGGRGPFRIGFFRLRAPR